MQRNKNPLVLTQINTLSRAADDIVGLIPDGQGLKNSVLNAIAHAIHGKNWEALKNTPSHIVIDRSVDKPVFETPVRHKTNSPCAPDNNDETGYWFLQGERKPTKTSLSPIDDVEFVDYVSDTSETLNQAISRFEGNQNLVYHELELYGIHLTQAPLVSRSTTEYYKHHQVSKHKEPPYPIDIFLSHLDETSVHDIKRVDEKRAFIRRRKTTEWEISSLDIDDDGNVFEMAVACAYSEEISEKLLLLAARDINAIGSDLWDRIQSFTKDAVLSNSETFPGFSVVRSHHTFDDGYRVFDDRNKTIVADVETEWLFLSLLAWLSS